MTALVITCAQCFTDYEPTRADILAGIQTWRLCPDCRGQSANSGARLDKPEPVEVGGDE